MNNCFHTEHSTIYADVMGGRKQKRNAECHTCTDEFLDGDRVLSCVQCKFSFHNDCVNVKRMEYDKVKKLKDWCCSAVCRSAFVGANTDELNDLPSNPTNRQLLDYIIGIKKSQDMMSDKYDELLAEFKEMRVRLNCLEKENVTLKKQIQAQAVSHNHIKNNASQKELECNILITGINNSDDPALAVKKLVSKIDAAIDTSACVAKVKRLYTLARKDDRNVSVPIVVELKSTDEKNKVIAAFKAKRTLLAGECGLTGDQNKIVVMEQMSNYNYGLMKEARKLKTAGTIKFVWFQNSNVLVRKDDNTKIIKITSIDDLNKI